MRKRSQKHFGWSMYRKCNGFTLLEIVIYMGLSLVICLIGYKEVMQVKNIYLKSIEESLSINSVEEAFITIDKFAREIEVISISNINNKLVINKGHDTDDSYEKRIIEESEGNLLIKYYDSKNILDYKGRSTLIIKISDFNVISKGKLIYITFKKGGVIYTKCL